MSLFAIIIGLILAAVTLVLTSPFWRRGPGHSLGGPVAARDVTHELGGEPEHLRVVQEKDALLAGLTDLEQDRAEERLAQADYERLKTLDEHRLAGVLERLDRARLSGRPSAHDPARGAGALPAPAPSSERLRWVTATALSLVVAGSAAGIYGYNHSRPQGLAGGASDVREAQTSGASGGPGSQPRLNPLEMVARLETRLRQNPRDLQGQIMAGRSYMTLQRWEDAKKAWGVVVELDPRNHEAHFNVGWLLIQTRTGNAPAIFEQAITQFDAALINVPRDPVVLWYRGVALVHLGRNAEADANWTDAFQALPPGGDDATLVGDALKRLRAGEPPLR